MKDRVRNEPHIRGDKERKQESKHIYTKTPKSGYTMSFNARLSNLLHVQEH